MPRRRTVVLASAAVLFVIGGLLTAVFVTATRTAYGRELLRAYAEELVNSKIKGKMHIGKVTGTLFGSIVIDTFALRGLDDSLFVSTGPIRIDFNPRDLFDRRIYASRVHVERPIVHLHEDTAGTWNWRRIFPSGPPKPPGPATQRNWGEYVVVENAILERATVRVTIRWQPNDSLRGAKRDSAIAYNLQRTDRIIRRVPGTSAYEQSFVWTNARLDLSRGRIDDKEPGGRIFAVRRLDADEFFPPFKFRNARGSVRLDGDSLWLDVAHFELPGSKGSAEGKVWWGNGLPTRYDLRVVSDDVALADINWVYPTLPTEGGGKMKLHIHNHGDTRNELNVLQYTITDMDMRTGNSHLVGEMTFAVGGPVLAVTGVNVVAEPLDFAFLHQIAGEPLPYPWRGTITGTLRARGGPVNAFVVDDADLVFRDANVPGAVAIARGNGELDIYDPSFTVFRGFRLNLQQFDLRTIQFLNPAFPRFDGIIAGNAVLDSSWLDIRVRDADITHRVGDLPLSRFVGGGRVTFGETFLTYDLAMQASPISLGTIAAAYREDSLPFRGTYTGPIRLLGTLEDLDVSTELRGPPGMLAFDGRVDADSVNGYGANGELRFSDLDLRALFDTTAYPVSALNGRATMALRGDSLATLNGSLGIEIDRSLVDSVRVFDGRARVRFANRRMLVDTLSLDTPVAMVTGNGALALDAVGRGAGVDTLRFFAAADSLGGIRRFLVAQAGADSVAAREAATDSLLGRVTATGALSGALDSLTVHLTLDGAGVKVGETWARRLHGDVALTGVTATLGGTVSLTADTVVAAGLDILALGGRLQVVDGRAGRRQYRFDVGATSMTGQRLEAGGTARFAADTSDVMLTQVTATVDNDQWELSGPGRILATRDGVRVDTLVLSGNGRITLAGDLPNEGAVSFVVRVDSTSMKDLAAIGQSRVSLGGLLDARLEVVGPRNAPVMTLTGEVREGEVADVNLQRIALAGSYRDRRVQLTLVVSQENARVLDVYATVPYDLRLVPVTRRTLDDTLAIGVRAREVDLELLESFVPTLVDPEGALSADFALRGRPNQTSLGGFLRVTNGAVTARALGNLRLRNIDIDVRADRDTLFVRHFRMRSGPNESDTLWLGGHVAFTDTLPQLDLSVGARSVRVVVPRSADLQVTGNLRLNGSERYSELSGGVRIERGDIRIPELTDKEIINLNDPNVYTIIDTTVFANRGLLPRRTPPFLRNLVARNVQITIGDDVWLRSQEANIKLGGAVDVEVARQVQGRSVRDAQAVELALLGRLNTQRGTYELDLGVVRRTFNIEGGELRFLGDPDLNPILDISAVYTVPQIRNTFGARNDVRIRAQLQGTFEQPRIVLESADSLALSQSDLISYLVTGAPSFEIGGLANDRVATGAGLLLSFLSSEVSRLYAGRFVDYVQLQTNVGSPTGTSTEGLGLDLFRGVQLGLGKQINDRTWVTASAGFCRGQTGQTVNPFSFDRLGLRLEHRLREGLGVSISNEPATQAVFCGTDRSFVPTPRQYGFDIWRAWRW